MISREEVLHQRTSAYGVRIRPETVTAWSFLLPTVLLLLVLAVYPLIYAFFLSMTDAQVSGPVHFVGVRNFIRLLRTAIFTLTLSNTVWYTRWGWPWHWCWRSGRPGCGGSAAPC